jgi:predicted nucleic acid-binding protein
MSNNVFVDSSVLIEPLQNRKIQFYASLVANIHNIYCINSIVVSEYFYKYIGIQRLGSPKTVQENHRIKEALDPYFINNFLENFLFIEPDKTIISLVPSLMSKYNLLPNDAIILATCKIYNITQLASHDKDFIEPCRSEGIELLREEG